MKIKYLIFINLFIFILFLVGCDPKKETKYVFEEMEEMNLVEPMDEDIVSIYFKPMKISLNNIDLYFDSDISKKECISYIHFVQDMVAKIETDGKLIYYISEEFSNRVTDGVVYLKYSESFKKINFLIFTLQSIYGVTANYGLLYGYSNYLMGNEVKVSVEELKSLNEDDYYLFDLTLPLFMEDYTPNEIIEITKKISSNFVGYLIENKGTNEFLNLLINSAKFDISFDNLFASLEKEWLNSIEVNLELVPLDILIRFSNISYFYPLKLETSWMEYFFQYDYLEKQQHLYPIRFTNYKELREFMVVTESEMAQVREFIGGNYSVEKYGKPHIYYVYYEYISYPKKVSSADVTLHEYVHFITPGSMYIDIKDSFTIEGLATYLQYTLNPVDIESFKEEFEIMKLFYADAKPIGDDNWDIYVESFVQYFIESEKEFTPFEYFDHLMYFWYMKGNPYYQQHYQGASFTNYLVNKYGKEKYMKYYSTYYRFKSIDGKTDAELIDEWKQYLKDKFE